MVYWSWPGFAFHLAGLPEPSKEVRRVVRIRVASFIRGWRECPAKVLVALRDGRAILWFDGMQDASIVLVVSSEKEKKEAEEAVSKVMGKWASLFVVELED